MEFNFQMWLYGAGSVLFISVVGLCCILIIPMIKNHHGNIIQLLVGLAIGTLTSDALLHLLPHTFNQMAHKTHSSLLSNNSHSDHSHSDHSHSDHSHSDHSHATPVVASHDDQHLTTLYYGLVSLLGIIGFLIIERAMTIISDLCHNSRRKTSKIANCDRPATKIKPTNPNAEPCETDKLTEEPNQCKKEHLIENGLTVSSAVRVDGEQGDLNLGSADVQLTTEQCHRETILYPHPDPDKGFVVQLTEHHHHHHHHNQGGTTKSVIMMIVTGDGLHNFFDGLAIGIAYANGGVGGGLSTSIAILCHELPHEVGDFAVLLSAGLSVKRAVMYNALSAFLCFIGMSVGIIVGNLDTGYCSALIAGMFLYISLVNMIPQLDCCPMQSSGHRTLKLSIQVAGICIGVGIMFTISMFEESIQTYLSGSQSVGS